MKSFLKRYIIKIPTDINVYYDDKKQILLINGLYSKKILKLNVQLEICKKKGNIKVLNKTFKTITIKNKKTIKSIRGTTVALLKQAFLETSSVVSTKLNLIGVGFKAFQIKTTELNLIQMKLGYSHDIYFKIPKTINIKSHKTTNLFVSGHNIQKISQTASLIRKCKIPEPYKGKGISYNNESIKLKEGKKV